MAHLDEADPTEVSWEYAVALLAGELAALRTRLAAVETAVGQPRPLGAPAPPSLLTLARRVAALERQAGLVPGLDLLAGTPAAREPQPAVAAPAPRTRGQVWRDRGQAVLAAVLLLAVFIWLLRPTVQSTHPAPPPAPTASVSTVSAARCDGPASAGCAGHDGHRATPAASAGWLVEFVAAPPPCDLQTSEGTCAPPFTPARLVIHAGDHVTWHVMSGLHTVTFPAAGTPSPSLYVVGPGEAAGKLNPLATSPQGGAVYDGTALVGSGLLDDRAPAYRLTFPQPGHYTYVDLAQPALVGEIIVLPATDQPPASWCAAC